jgi:hypothetical protein
MSGLILPNATLGVVHRIGEIMSPDFKNGVCLFVRDNLVTLRIFKDGAKFYEVSFGEAQCSQMAEFFKRGADMIERQGGSGLPESRTVKAQVA